ncbi:MAG TPA: hypothetical protein VK595_05945, partial [Vicinamibacterales bacterium]|nr:hypothetical protein [Vicinamibacterales bacterium]
MASFEVRIGSYTAPSGVLAFSTGALLGGGRDTRAFYESHDDGDTWELTYSYPQNAGKGYAGALVSARWANATWFQEGEGDGDVTDVEADANTQHFIDQLAAYRQAGVLAVSVGFECGNPINNEADPAIDDGAAGIQYDLSGGSPSAFTQDGTGLKVAHVARMESLIEAANAERVGVVLQFFYARQCRWLST